MRFFYIGLQPVTRKCTDSLYEFKIFIFKTKLKTRKQGKNALLLKIVENLYKYKINKIHINNLKELFTTIIKTQN